MSPDASGAVVFLAVLRFSDWLYRQHVRARAHITRHSLHVTRVRVRRHHCGYQAHQPLAHMSDRREHRRGRPTTVYVCCALRCVLPTRGNVQ
jgi:hypothetical protein